MVRTKRERRIIEREAEGKRWELCIRTHVCMRRKYIDECVSIVGVASVAADVAAVPRYRRGCLAALHQPSRHDLSALSTTIPYPPFYHGFLSLSGASILDRLDARLADLRPAALHTLRFVQGRPTKCVWCVCGRISRRPIQRQANGSREGRLMRSRVSLAELFHEIRVSIYECRSRRFLSLGIGRTFIILRERIRIEVENKKKLGPTPSVIFILKRIKLWNRRVTKCSILSILFIKC